MAAKMTVDFSQLNDFKKAFSDIVATSKRSVDEEVLFKARDLAYKLYQSFDRSSLPKMSPRALAESLGWKISRKYKLKENPTSQRSVAFIEAERRTMARRFIAASWLPAIKSFGRGRKPRIRPVSNPRGGINISSNDKGIVIEIVNKVDGASIVDQRYGHVRSALNVVIADMKAKIQERLTRTIDGKIRSLLK
jgi:hypothetical protein